MKSYLRLVLIVVCLTDCLSEEVEKPLGNGNGANINSNQFRQDIPILRYENNVNFDGSYNYAYETGNGIAAEERGHLQDYGNDVHGQVAEGGFRYTAPTGEEIFVKYIADKDGFRAEGPYIPTPPPIPEAILRSIEFNKAQAAKGYVDGEYRPEVLDLKS